MITITLEFPDSYYRYMADKYRFSDVNEVFTIEDNEIFCKEWIKQQILQKILEPDYIAARQKEIDYIKLAIKTDAEKLKDAINVE